MFQHQSSCPACGLNFHTHSSQFSESSRKLFITFIFQRKDKSSICKERGGGFVPFHSRALLTTHPILANECSTAEPQGDHLKEPKAILPLLNNFHIYLSHKELGSLDHTVL